jgi:outer membrane biosynthesis protein TonB
MPHLDWRVAGAAGLAAGLTVGGFSLVSASGIDQAIKTVEATESRAAPAAEGIRFVASRTTTPPAHIVDLASRDVVTVEMPPKPAEPTATPKPTPVATHKPDPTATPKPAPAATHKPDPTATPKPAPAATHKATPAPTHKETQPAAHPDDCASCVDSADGTATCVDSVASVASVDSDD